MESSETTSTVNALGLIPLFSLECRVVLAEVQCSGQRSAGVVGGGRNALAGEKGRGGWLVEKIGLAAILGWSEYTARADVGCPYPC